MWLNVENLGHSFSDAELFTNLNHRFLPGKLYGIIGPSGSGKSTLLAILGGFISPSSGKVSFSNDLKTSWVFQNPHGVARRTVLELATIPLLAQGLPQIEAKLKAKRALEVFGLETVINNHYRKISGGEAQRLMLARASLSNPKLLLIDEPTSQLDPVNKASVHKVIVELKAEQRITILASHDPETVKQCEEIIDLSNYAAI